MFYQEERGSRNEGFCDRRLSRGMRRGWPAELSGLAFLKETSSCDISAVLSQETFSSLCECP